MHLAGASLSPLPLFQREHLALSGLAQLDFLGAAQMATRYRRMNPSVWVNLWVPCTNARQESQDLHALLRLISIIYN
jgi:hypothetical protein